jgi:hypothetical protein
MAFRASSHLLSRVLALPFSPHTHPVAFSLPSLLLSEDKGKKREGKQPVKRHRRRKKGNEEGGMRSLYVDALS